MLNKYVNIFKIYLSNRIFVALSVTLLICAVTSKILYTTGHPVLAENFSTLLFVCTLWIAIQLGHLVKHQFSNHRSTLLSGYRVSHIVCAGLIFIFFVGVAVIWEQGLMLLMRVTPDGLIAAYLACLFMALFIVYLGYLSIGRIFIYFYVFALIIAMNGSEVLRCFELYPSLKYGIVALTGLFSLAFVRRLITLKEEHFEYHFILSWPPKKYFINQLRSEKIFIPLKRVLKVKSSSLDIPSYPRSKGLLSRSNHWDYTDQLDIKIVGVIFILLTPLYLLFMKSNPLFSDFFKGAYSNFLLLSMTPVLVTLGSHYKKLAYCEHDLLKPVTREQYIKERGVVLVLHLMSYWLIFTLCFAVLPNIIFDPYVFTSSKFWMFLLLTLNFALLFTVWLVWLACVSNASAVIVSGLILSVVLLFQFYYSDIFSVNVIVVSNLICLCGVIVLLKKAYLAWCRKEFI